MKRTGLPWRTEIQGLRGIAVLMVVAYHADLPVPGGFAGVDVFFVVSGFFITGLLVARLTARADFSTLRGFIATRFWRLFPAMSVAVLFTAIIAPFVLPPLYGQPVTLRTGVAAMFSLSNLATYQLTSDYFSSEAKNNALLHLWTLSLEVQIYLTLTMLIVPFFFTGRRLSSRRNLAMFAIGLMTVISGFVVLSSMSGIPIHNGVTLLSFLTSFYGPVVRFWEFGAGSLLALSQFRASMRVGWIFQNIGILLLLVSLFAPFNSSNWPNVGTLLPVVGALCVCLPTTKIGGDPKPASFLNYSVLQWLGGISYSWYLWHWPFIVFARSLFGAEVVVATVAAFLSIVPATLSYYFVERPARHMPLKIRLRSLRFSLVAILLVSPVTGALVVNQLNSHPRWSNENMSALVLSQELPLVGALGCQVPRNDFPGEKCKFDAKDPDSQIVYLVGDSNAGHFGEGLRLATSRLGLGLEFATSCVYSSLLIEHLPSPGWGKNCQEMNTLTDSYLLSKLPGIVIISNSDHYWLAPWPNSAGYVLIDDGSQVIKTQDKVRALENDLRKRINRLQGHGHKVILVKTVPHFEAVRNSYDPESCLASEIESGACFSTTRFPEFKRQQGVVWDVYDRVGASENIFLVDLTEEICGTYESCSVRGLSFIRYRDGHHISKMMSENLGPRWETLLTKLPE